MPLYEYRCTNCGEEFEKMVRLSEADQNPTCPACQSQDTWKKISSVAFLGKSSGGYRFASTSNCGSGGGFS
jgi:putative FmdB family regulatory protein